MLKHVVALALIGLGGLGPVTVQKPPKQGCLHGSSEALAQAMRREAALRLARELIATEAAAHRQAQSYYALSDLPGLPPAPEGFRVQLSTDGASYTFSIKDTLDSCRFALFSDQEGVIYSATPTEH